MSTQDAHPSHNLPPTYAWQRAEALARASATPPAPRTVVLPVDDGDPEFVPEVEEALTLPAPNSQETEALVTKIQRSAAPAPQRAFAADQAERPALPTTPVTIVHPLADFTVHALDVILSPQMITLLMPKTTGARFAPKQSTEFEMVVRGVHHRVMACSDAADSAIFPCSIIAFLRLKMDDKE